MAEELFRSVVMATSRFRRLLMRRVINRLTEADIKLSEASSLLYYAWYVDKSEEIDRIRGEIRKIIDELRSEERV